MRKTIAAATAVAALAVPAVATAQTENTRRGVLYDTAENLSYKIVIPDEQRFPSKVTHCVRLRKSALNCYRNFYVRDHGAHWVDHYLVRVRAGFGKVGATAVAVLID